MSKTYDIQEEITRLRAEIGRVIDENILLRQQLAIAELRDKSPKYGKLCPFLEGAEKGVCDEHCPAAVCAKVERWEGRNL